jgi:hypothetical protein
MESSLTYDDVLATLLALWSARHGTTPPPAVLESLANAVWVIGQHRLQPTDERPELVNAVR